MLVIWRVNISLSLFFFGGGTLPAALIRINPHKREPVDLRNPPQLDV